MAEIYMNSENIKLLIEEYKKKDKTFGVKNLLEKDNKIICNFHVKGKECRVSFYLKKKTINIIPEGKNKEEANLLIDFIVSKGLDTKVEAKTVVFKCNLEIINKIITYFDEERVGVIQCLNVAENRYKFVGYNKDEITLTFYPQKEKAMIQGKPLQAFCIVATYLSELDDFDFEEIVQLNNSFSGVCTASSVIRGEMKSKLGSAYTYLPEALKKSISGSLSLLKSKNYCEDYKGCLAGDFVALEGYMKEILTKKYKMKLQKKNTFSMFYIDSSTGKSAIDLDTNITKLEKIELKNLYKLYTDKRNVYLHATVDASLTAVIDNIKDAQSLSDEILNTIKESYDIIYK